MRNSDCDCFAVGVHNCPVHRAEYYDKRGEERRQTEARYLRMNRPPLARRASPWVIALTFVLFITFMVGLAHCKEEVKAPNSLGTLSYQTNPLMYTAATSITGANQVENNLNLRIRPLGTYLLYDEAILFCGMPLEKFEGVRAPFLLTYERVSHRAVNGIGCHNLIRVDQLIKREGQ